MKKSKQVPQKKKEKGHTICLNMIVRNEAHIVHELIEVVANYIDYWVVVDTGSDDGTQALIPELMRKKNIPGQMYERPWKNFGHNRSEAIELAQGHCDYILVMDADDTIVGELSLENLEADCYSMRIKDGLLYWRLQLFRNGLPWRYTGVLHELATCDAPFKDQRLEGDYYVHSRRLGGRNLDPKKYEKDAAILLAEVEKHPEDARSVFYLAQSYASAGILNEAIHWYSRRAEMGGWEEEIYYSLYCVASLMERMNEPWPVVQEAYLRAWSQRPTRAEALHAIARRNRQDQRYLIGHLFAERAAQIPLPEHEVLFVSADIYEWRALDEQAVCASWIGRSPECFEICRELLARPDLPDEDRQRIAANRDLAIPLLLQETARYPETVPVRLPPRDPVNVSLTMIAGPDREAFERLINSFLNCCLDHEHVDRFLVLDAGLSDADRFLVLDRYRFLEFLPCPEAKAGDQRFSAIRKLLNGRFWLHMDAGWQFFAPEPLIARLQAVLKAEPTVVQVGINLFDASAPSATSPREDEIRRAAGTGRYLIATAPSVGPSLVDLARFDAATGQAKPAATLDEVFCQLTT